MSGGPNGLRPVEVLADRRKCPLHPSKARFSEAEAEREAAARADRTKLPIEPYLCEGCGFWHLTKASRGTARLDASGTYSLATPTAPVPARVPLPEPEPDGPLIPANREAKRKVVRALLESTPEPTTNEVQEVLMASKETVRLVMGDLGYRNTKGRHARWVLKDSIDVPVIDRETGEPVRLPAEPQTPAETREDALLRDELSWTTLDPSGVSHLALADLVAAYAAVGWELRVEVRPA